MPSAELLNIAVSETFILHAGISFSTAFLSTQLQYSQGKGKLQEKVTLLCM